VCYPHESRPVAAPVARRECASVSAGARRSVYAALGSLAAVVLQPAR
jgi:hypothetical protein